MTLKKKWGFSEIKVEKEISHIPAHKFLQLRKAKLDDVYDDKNNDGAINNVVREISILMEMKK